jgi:hypothetical protein
MEARTPAMDAKLIDVAVTGVDVDHPCDSLERIALKIQS